MSSSSTTVDQVNDPSSPAPTTHPPTARPGALHHLRRPAGDRARRTIVNIALPHIEEGLGFSRANRSWVLTIYTLAFGGVLLLGGRLGDLYGRRRMFVWGVALFASPRSSRASREPSRRCSSPARSRAWVAHSPPRRPRAHHDDVPGRQGAQQGDGCLRRDVRRRSGHRAHPRWRADRDRLALDFFINLPIGILVAIAAQRSSPSRGRQGLARHARRDHLDRRSLLARLRTDTRRERLVERPDDRHLPRHRGGAAHAFVVIETRVAHPLLPMRIPGDRTRGTSYFYVILIVGAGDVRDVHFLGISSRRSSATRSDRSGVPALLGRHRLRRPGRLASHLAGRPAVDLALAPRSPRSACGASPT